MPGRYDTSEQARRKDVDVSGLVERDRDADRRSDAAERRVRELERENERLSELLDVLGHDLRNHLAVARGRLDLARRDVDSEDLESAARAHDRMEELLDDLLAARDEGFDVGDPEPVSLGASARRAWAAVDADGAELVAGSNLEFLADPPRLVQLLENLFRNAVEHGAPGPRSDVTVGVGTLSDGSGFFVEDDGRGLPKTERDRLFEDGFSTSESGTGLGLSIVEDVVTGHGWDVDATASAAGGARFEITGVRQSARRQGGRLVE